MGQLLRLEETLSNKAGYCDAFPPGMFLDRSVYHTMSSEYPSS